MHSRLQQQTMCPLTISVMKTFSSEHHYQSFVVHRSKVVQLENNISPHFGLVTRKNVFLALARLTWEDWHVICAKGECRAHTSSIKENSLDKKKRKKREGCRFAAER